MPVEEGYKISVVILDRHEPEGETTTRLLEIADEKGYGPRVVEAQRGEHDSGLSFRVPRDVAEVFESERADLWPDDSAQNRELNQQRVDGTVSEDPPGKGSKIENVAQKASDKGVDGDSTQTRSRTGR